MKRSILTLLLIFFINAYGQTSPTNYQTVFQTQLKSWTKCFKDFNLENFEKVNEQSFESTETEISDLNEYYELYQPLLIYSGDKTKFLDLYSLQLNLKKVNNKLVATTEIDQGILLCDAGKSTCKRILFFGTIRYIEDAVWVSDHQFILAGTSLPEEESPQSENIPVIYIGDTNSQSFDVYINKKSTKIKHYS